MASVTLADFLPGHFTIAPGSAGDYDRLAQFHYCAARPATWSRIWAVRFHPQRAGASARLVAVGVLSYPVPSCSARERWFNLRGTRREKLVFLNAYVRTISRVVVHPQFRSVGLASILVRWMCQSCPTRYVEAIARMGAVHPMFERAGMTRVPALAPDEPAYFVFDREHVTSSVAA